MASPNTPKKNAPTQPQQPQQRPGAPMQNKPGATKNPAPNKGR